MDGDRTLAVSGEARRRGGCIGAEDGAGIAAFACIGVASDDALSGLSRLMGAGPMGVRLQMTSSGHLGCRCCVGPPPLFAGIDPDDGSLAPGVSERLRELPLGAALAVKGATAALEQSVVVIGDQTCRVTGTVEVAGETEELVLLHLSDLSHGLVYSQGRTESSLATTAVYRRARSRDGFEAGQPLEARAGRLGWRLVSKGRGSVPISAGDPRSEAPRTVTTARTTARSRPGTAPEVALV